jgi:hypothetical protein
MSPRVLRAGGVSLVVADIEDFAYKHGTSAAALAQEYGRLIRAGNEQAKEIR